MSEAKERYDELFAWFKPEENPDAPNWMKVVYDKVTELEQQNKELIEVVVDCIDALTYNDRDNREFALKKAVNVMASINR